MSRVLLSVSFAAALSGLVLLTSGCRAADGQTTDSRKPAAGTVVSVAATAAVEQPLTRFIRATGSLTAEEEADVAAEVAGRVTATPVERGSRVALGSELVRLSSTETDAQS